MPEFMRYTRLNLKTDGVNVCQDFLNFFLPIFLIRTWEGYILCQLFK